MSEQLDKKFSYDWLYKHGFSECSTADRTTVNVSFKKTVLLRQYETEVIELNTSLSFDKNIGDKSRAWAVATAEAQLEISCYENLLAKGYVTKEEFNDRAAQISEYLDLFSKELSKK